MCDLDRFSKIQSHFNCYKSTSYEKLQIQQLQSLYEQLSINIVIRNVIFF